MNRLYINMGRYACIICILFLYASCGATNAVVLSGVIENINTDETEVVLDYLTLNTIETISKSDIKPNGEFKIQLKDKKPGWYRLRVGYEYLTGVFLLDEHKVQVNYDGQTNQYEVEGSPATTYYLQKVADFRNMQSEVNELQENYNAMLKRGISTEEKQQFIIDKSNKEKEIETLAKTYLQDESIYLSLFAIDFIPIDDANLDLYKSFVQRLKASELANTPYVQEFDLRVQDLGSNINKQSYYDALNIGDEAPNIHLPMADGSSYMSLYDYRGKVVLVDFWASWCAPCRKANRYLVDLYEKYKLAGFEIYAISQDTKKDRWLSAIEQDNLQWKGQVNDLVGNDDATQKFNVFSIPASYLIDRNGQVIGINLKEDELAYKLRQVFGY